MKYFRNTHDDGEPRKLSDLQQGVWNAQATLVGHMLESNRGLSLQELTAQLVKYHYDHFEDCENDHRDKHGAVVMECPKEPKLNEVSLDLLALLEANLAYLDHQKRLPSWYNRVLAYAVGYLNIGHDAGESKPWLEGIGIFSEENPTTTRRMWQFTVAQEYQISATDGYHEASRRLIAKLKTEVVYSWTIPHLKLRAGEE